MHSPSSSRAIHIDFASPSPFRSSSASLISSTLCAAPRTLALGVANNYKRKYLSVRGRRSDFSDQHRVTGRPPSPLPEEPASFSRMPTGALNSKVFVGYSIYKGKAALTMVPRAPEFSPLDSGAYKVSKEGFILLQFAPSVGNRQYDWSRNEEGKIRKVLKVEPLPDGTGYFFNLSVQNRLLNMDDSIYIPISKPEFTILNSALNFIVPYLLGWHSFANAIKPENSFRLNNARLRADFEWGR